MDFETEVKEWWVVEEFSPDDIEAGGSNWCVYLGGPRGACASFHAPEQDHLHRIRDAFLAAMKGAQ